MPYAASVHILTSASAKPESTNSNPAQLAPEFWLTFWPELTAVLTASNSSSSKTEKQDPTHTPVGKIYHLPR